MNAKNGVTRTGHQERGTRPGVNWEIDFMEVKPGLCGYRYLSVFLDTFFFFGWTEPFPTKSEMAVIILKKLLEEIIPRYGLPMFMGS